MIKEAVLYKKLTGNKVVCKACARECKLAVGQIGVCGVRQNIDGKLNLLVYGKIITAHVDPIEKKPVSHFMPGSKAFSIGTSGCNWMCAYCCNFDISQRRKIEGFDVTPESIVRQAKDYGCGGIAYTYNEPTIFIEFAHDTGILARKENLVNIFVSNGYQTTEAVRMMSKFLDAITVDIKGNAEANFLRKYVSINNPEPIFQTLLEIKNKTRIHLEITDLIVPKIGDNLEEARRLMKWIYENLGPDVPVHFLRFHPTYKLVDLPPTPTKTLEKHHKIAKEAGLNYVYIGNVPGHELENTFCPKCGKIVVERSGFDIIGWHLDENNKCSFCGYPIAITGKLSKSVSEDRFFPVM